MKDIKKCFTICFVMFFLISINSAGQVADCYENYERALKLYNSGLDDSVLIILNPCLENNKAHNRVSKELDANIYRLAALSCIMKNDPAKAEYYIKQLLKYQPDYKNKFRDDDLMEFRVMINSNHSQPAFRIGVVAGGNIPLVKLKKRYSDYETAAGNASSLGMSSGNQLGIAGEIKLSKYISLEVDAEMSKIYFRYTVNGLALSQNKYDESLTLVEIPVLVRFYFPTNSSFKPYLQGGVSENFSLNNMERSGVYGRYWFTKSSGSDKILTTFLTDFKHTEPVLGGGFGYDFKKFNLRLDFRYNFNIKNSTLSSKFDSVSGYPDITSDEKFYYTNDINLISMKNIQISLGFLYNLKYKVF